MSCLKIPDLNLFRGKRQTKVNQIDHIEQAGLRMIKKGNHKQLIDEIQAELYLDNYKANLKHFVSPTKYKQQAERYLKQNRMTDEIYLKALQLPRTQKYCPNCYDQYFKAKKPCYCELEPKIPSLSRYQSSKHFPRYDKDVKVVIEQKKQRKQILNSQKEITSQDFILTESEVPRNESFHLPSQPIRQQSNSIIHVYSNRIVPDSQSFLKDIKRRQDYLEGINMNMGQSRNLDIDFKGLSQAKKQYVQKSHEILDRLNQIIRQHDRNG